MTRAAMLIPSRGRPDSVHRMAEAWEQTGAAGEADCVWVIDNDDPGWARYMRNLARYPWMQIVVMEKWEPLVPKLNCAARLAANEEHRVDLIGFMGDDHLPRSYGWPWMLAAAAETHGPGIFYGRDGYKDIRLPTWWAMSASIVRALDCMVPGKVDHLYCDNVVLELGKAARCLRFLPSVFIEHMHPIASKSEWDEGYLRVNSNEQYEKDRQAFLTWLGRDRMDHAKILRELVLGQGGV